VSENKRDASSGPDPVAEMFTSLRAALAAGAVLPAEVETARCCAFFHQLGIDQDKSGALLIGMAMQGGTPEDAALLRLLMLLGSPAARERARTALGELTAKGVYPSSWVAEAGKAEPVRALRVPGESGDWEDIHITFRYASGEHTLVARVDLADPPLAQQLTLIEGEMPAEQDRPSTSSSQELSLAGARARLEPALLANESDGFLPPDAAALTPIAKSRLRRLPAS
jgi:hypothetical protein